MDEPATIESLARDIKTMHELLSKTTNHVLDLHQKVTLPFRTRAMLTFAGAAVGAGISTFVLELGLMAIRHFVPLAMR